MAIAMKRGEMRWSPTGLVSCRKEFGFVLRTKESRMGTSSKMASWLLCVGRQECKEHSNLLRDGIRQTWASLVPVGFVDRIAMRMRKGVDTWILSNLATGGTIY